MSWNARNILMADVKMISAGNNAIDVKIIKIKDLILFSYHY